MYNFEYYMYTDMVFGRQAEKEVAKKVIEYDATKVMLVYGMGSIKRSGLYDTVVNELRAAGIPFVELGGVQPNPRLSLVYEGLELVKRSGVDFLLALGGGSAIDTAKAIALGMENKGNLWDFYTGKAVPRRMAPVGVILTISAAGSEASRSSVLLDDINTHRKKGIFYPICRPVFALMNPELTYSVSPFQTGAGASDIFAHTVERYFINEESFLGDRLAEGLFRTVVKYAPIAIHEPYDYEARAELMLGGAVSHNDMTGLGRGAWEGSCHALEVPLSSIYDTVHGAGLAAIMPAWMEYVCNNISDRSRFVQFATNVFDVEKSSDSHAVAMEGIRRFRAWLQEIGMPAGLREMGVEKEAIPQLVKTYYRDPEGKIGSFLRLSEEDTAQIYRLAL